MIKHSDAINDNRLVSNKSINSQIANTIVIVLFAFNTVPQLYRYYSLVINLILIAGYLFMTGFEKTINKTEAIRYSTTLFAILFISVALNIKNLPITYRGFLMNLLYGCIYSSVFIRLCKLNRKEDLKKIINILLIIFSVVMIIASIRLTIMPKAARFISGTASEDVVRQYMDLGIPNFGLAYSVAFLYYPILRMIEATKKIVDKIIMATFLVITTIFLVKASFSMAYFVVILQVYLFVIAKVKKTSIKVIVTVFSAILIIDNLLSINGFLLTTLENAGLSVQASKIRQLISLESGGGFDSINRYSLYRKSIDAFISSPLVGTSNCGEHSHFFDMLSVFGLTSIVFIIPMVRDQAVWKEYIQKKDYAIMVIVFLLFILLNTFLSMQQMICWYILTPLILYLAIKSEPQLK